MTHEEKYGNATPEMIAAFEAEYKAGVEAEQIRLANGRFGDAAEALTDEDEAILTRAWSTTA